MNKKINVIGATNNFGLGPVGKLSSIVTATKDLYNWYACGNEFDLEIFEEAIFVDKLFSKEKDKIKKFVADNNIVYAIIVLDVELASILLEIGVKVIFIDSLPFMWTQADIDEGLLPLNSTVYCAQKCVELTENSKNVLNQIDNLRWIDPIIQKNINSYTLFNKEPYVLINLGGLHSPIGNGESYINTVLLPLLEVLKKQNYGNILITCGSNARVKLCEVLEKEKFEKLKIVVETLKQSDFIGAVGNSSLFFTSPGLTTIYETASLKKDSIYLPPQNLSQFYNIKFAEQITENYKILNWNTEKLNIEHLKSILDKGETYVVNKIYSYITELQNNSLFIERFKDEIVGVLNSKYNKKASNQFNINGNGVDDIIEILSQLSEKEQSKIKILIATKNISKFKIVTNMIKEILPNKCEYYSLLDVKELIEIDEIGTPIQRAFNKAQNAYEQLKNLNYYDLIIGIDDGIIIDDELSVNVKEHLYDIMVSDKVEIGEIIYITRAYSIIDKNGKSKNVFNKIPYRLNRKVKNIANHGYQLNSVLSMLDDNCKVLDEFSDKELNEYYLLHSKDDLMELFEEYI